ncbi:MAG: phosphoribosyltransferase [Actinobacteria bacterium]|nr:phosphoribosyltransferase [Actinomycetota bacterium]
MGSTFEDRRDAGSQLADRVAELDLSDPVVLGLPRGGVPVAAEVADRLDAPLDVVVVRKVGAPHNPEYGIGAVGEGDVVVLNEGPMRQLGLSRDDLQDSIEEEQDELRRRLGRYRRGRDAVPLDDRSVVVVDDGLATGVTATAAAQVLRARGVEHLILAIPVGPPNNVQQVGTHYDDVVVLHTPDSFRAVGTWYRDFGQTSDDEVVDLLASHASG